MTNTSRKSPDRQAILIAQSLNQSSKIKSVANSSNNNSQIKLNMMDAGKNREIGNKKQSFLSTNQNSNHGTASKY